MLIDVIVYITIISSVLCVCLWIYKEHEESKKLYVSWYRDWEKLAVDSEHMAMLAEQENCSATADWLHEEAARRRINASKYIKYLPKEEQAKAIELNTRRKL